MSFSGRPARPGRSDARANRRRVLEAARQVLIEQGQDAEVREIAQKAGVGLATIYRGFGNKEGLLTAMAEQVNDDVLNLLSTAEAQAQPREGLRCFLVGAIDYVHAHGPLFGILAEHFRDEGREMHLELGARVGGLIERGVASGGFRADLNVAVVVHIIFSSLMAIAHSGALTPGVGDEELTQSLLSLLAAQQPA